MALRRKSYCDNSIHEFVKIESWLVLIIVYTTNGSLIILLLHAEIADANARSVIQKQKMNGCYFQQILWQNVS